MVNLNHLLELNSLAVKSIENYPKKRFLFNKLRKARGKHFTGITGPRGVGKTILLIQLAKETKDSFYISLDIVEEVDLFEITRHLNQKFGYTTFLFDEIHHQKDFPSHLKKIYDFLTVKLIFSSSVALSLEDASRDLSRRVQLLKLYPFSFREYIYFKHQADIPPLSLGDIYAMKWSPEHIRLEHLFEEYLRGGIMPFMLEEADAQPIMKGILKTIIQRDIPSFSNLKLRELPLIEKTVRFIGTSPVDGINYSSISKNIGITKYKAESYLTLLKKTYVLHVVFPTGTNVLREPKVLMHLPYRLLYREYDDARGGIREDFAVEALTMNNISVSYLKSTRGAKTPDFQIQSGPDERMIVEVGGRKKGREQFKGITVKKKMIFTQPGVIENIKRPLFLLGFLDELR